MTRGQSNDFYDSYKDFKDYETPQLSKKSAVCFDEEIWQALGLSADKSVLEIGCGTGLVLLYLKSKGVENLLGVDRDPALEAFVPAEVKDHFIAGDVFSVLGETDRKFDAVLLMDVVEHFSPNDAVALLRLVDSHLAPGGKVLLRTPNAASPWGFSHQFGDLTHCTPFCPGSMRQLALASGFYCKVCLPQYSGSNRRRFTDRLLGKILSNILMVPAEIWTANFYSLLERR